MSHDAPALVVQERADLDLFRPEMSPLARALLTARQGYPCGIEYPATIPPALPALRDEAAKLLAPIGDKGAAVLLAKLFVLWPLKGGASAIRIWLQFTAIYPARVLRRAIDEVIKTHVWATPPTPAEVVTAAEADIDYQQCLRLAHRIRYVEGHLEEQRQAAERERLRQQELAREREERQRQHEQRLAAEAAEEAENIPAGLPRTLRRLDDR